jgi:uncharacterized membrane protein HdeD (DUF308 family)
MPAGSKKYASVIIGAVLAIFGIFNIPSAILANDWGDFVIYAVLFVLGLYILRWALKE